MKDPQKPVVAFEVGFTQFLNSEGKLTSALPPFAEDPKKMIELYTAMVKNRSFDTKAITLQRTGQLGTYASTLGQEAIGVGIGAAMQKNDVFCPYYRDYGAQFWRGVKMSEVLLYWGGDERGSCYANKSEDFPICVPISSQTLHAVGVATAMKLRKEARVTVTVTGDGGTSRGDFYEAMNLAGIWKLPIVFVINNNQWAISMPRKEQTAAETLAQKGIAAGIPCEQIDGNDIISVYQTLSEAIEKARLGGGPSLIEALSYRMSDHTTADDAKRYRPLEEVEFFKKQDPIHRLNLYLTEKGFWNDEKEKALQEESLQEVEAAVQEYLNLPMDTPTAIFDYLYETLPLSLAPQRMEVETLQEENKHG
jgi:2-oxoisovalerate dehydrogenase E1 component alpha subunit